MQTRSHMTPQVSLLSKVRPRNLISLLNVSGTLPNFSVISLAVLLFVNRPTWVLDGFSWI